MIVLRDALRRPLQLLLVRAPRQPASPAVYICRMKRIAVLALRGLLLRCPNCGSRGLCESWFRMRERCPRCGFRLDRHEGEDYFLGGMMFNIVLSELIFAAGFVIALLATWPDVPWTLLEWVGIPFMVLAPVLFYPLSKTVWLAFDVMFRPIHAGELRADGDPAPLARASR